MNATTPLPVPDYAAPAKLPARRRTAGALAAFGATAAVLGLLVALFGAASSSPW